jgi:site-specific DNA-methyltransferase (adenine-specific)
MKENEFYYDLINDDCINHMKKMKENTVDLVVTSPPYNCGIDYDSCNDNKPFDEYVEWSRKWIDELYRVVKEDGRIAINVLVEQGIENNTKRISPMRVFCDLIEDAGFTIMGLPMWTDTHRVKFTAWGSYKSASSPYIYNPYEVVIIAYKKLRKKQLKGENTISKESFITGCSGVWNIRTDTKTLTKATFPVELPKLVIELLTFKGDLVLDPFSGSATTGVACFQTGRKYIGIEISKNYYDISKYRLENLTSQKELF